MTGSEKLTVEKFMAGLKRRNPGETEFHQAVCEVAASRESGSAGTR